MSLRWRRHQREAMEAMAARPSDRHWVVLPPGAGKTLLGVGATIGCPGRVIAFGPNRAIVEQWRRTWHEHTGEGTSSDRDLPTRFTALTYQALAVFDSAAEEASPLARLHPHGAALVRRLHEIGPVTIILDECHHLLQVWGSLLDAIVEDLPEARILALTATPPDMLTADQAERVRRLFGPITYQASIPSVVAAGDLTPFAELAWFTTPTAREDEWLDARATRVAELVTLLVDGTGLRIPLLTWLGLQDWRDLPDAAADAVIRLARAGHLALPETAHIAERHERAPSLEDWLAVAEGWLAALAEGSPEEQRRVRDVEALLPGVGFRRRRGAIVSGPPLVDRVLARSASKAAAAADIAAHTLAADPDARLLVLTDHVAATAIPDDLRGVVAPESGSARWVLETLAADPRLAGARPLAVTAGSIAGAADDLAALLPDVNLSDSTKAGVVVLEGDSPLWLEAATRALDDGWTRCLVGTRALLGEGWDARLVSGVIDLTSATTSTAIVQTRGRALRTDPRRPDKVAVNWTVTCLAPDRPQGDVDYRRLVRKHAGWFAPDEEGEVVEGVAHLDAVLSPDAPPDDVAQINARARARSVATDAIRDAWAMVPADREHAVATLRITGPGSARIPRDAATPAPVPIVARPASAGAGLAVLALAVMAAVGAGLPVAAVLGAAGVLLAGMAVFWRRHLRAVRRERARGPSLGAFARAVADALHAAGHTPVGADAVVLSLTAAGETRVRLEVGDAGSDLASEVFTVALAEILGIIEHPRYLIGRLAWDDRPPRWGEWGNPRPDREVWHAVPTILGVNRIGVDHLLTAWAAHIGPGRALYTGTPGGAGLVRALRWSSPMGEASGLALRQRLHW